MKMKTVLGNLECLQCVITRQINATMYFYSKQEVPHSFAARIVKDKG